MSVGYSALTSVIAWSMPGVSFGLRLPPSKPPQQPVVTMFDLDYDFDSSYLTDGVRSTHMDDETNPEYFLDHIRKAGGSTMRRWLEEVCKATHEDKYCGLVKEGSSLTDQMVEDIFGNSSSITVSVIHLREPVARAQALVNMNLHSLSNACKKGDFNQSHIDPSNCDHQTVSEELQRTSGLCSTSPATAIPNIPLWNCWQNMYVKSLVGTDRKNPTAVAKWLEVDVEDLELAKKRLAKFSGVVITEWLGNPAVAEYLSKHVFHLDQTIPFGHSYKHSTDDFHGFSIQEWARVASDNKYDEQLYEFAKELALQRMHDAGFSVSLDELEAH